MARDGDTTASVNRYYEMSHLGIKKDWAARYLDYLPWDADNIGIIQLIIQAVEMEYNEREASIRGGRFWEDWKYVLPMFINNHHV